METTERVVETYARYVLGCATIPNIRCDGQLEIDLLAINPKTLDRYHIESGVSISGYSKLTAKPYDAERLKVRVEQAGQRRTVGYFVERKFGSPSVLSALAHYGFMADNYARVIVTWDWTPDAAIAAEAHGVALWRFPDLLAEIVSAHEGATSYFTDDTLRTLHLFDRMLKERGRRTDTH